MFLIMLTILDDPQTRSHDTGKKVNEISHAARYPVGSTVQRAPPADWFIPTPTQLLWEAFSHTFTERRLFVHMAVKLFPPLPLPRLNWGNVELTKLTKQQNGSSKMSLNTLVIGVEYTIGRLSFTQLFTSVIGIPILWSVLWSGRSVDQMVRMWMRPSFPYYNPTDIVPFK